jgi:hypothetical protein
MLMRSYRLSSVATGGIEVEWTSLGDQQLSRPSCQTVGRFK